MNATNDEPLFPDTQPCGCPRGKGHSCNPPFFIRTHTELRQRYTTLVKETS